MFSHSEIKSAFYDHKWLQLTTTFAQTVSNSIIFRLYNSQLHYEQQLEHKKFRVKNTLKQKLCQEKNVEEN